MIQNYATLFIFICAVLHTFFSGWFRRGSRFFFRKSKNCHSERERGVYLALHELFNIFSETELVFAIWTIPLVWVLYLTQGSEYLLEYLYQPFYSEPLFIAIVMSQTATKPILCLSNQVIILLKKMFKIQMHHLWYICLIFFPLLGSFITEAAAMTLAVEVLKRYFYSQKLSLTLRYVTIVLLFLNVSVGGIVTNFAAPPALIMSHCWHWSTYDFLLHFAPPAFLGIITITYFYGKFVREELLSLDEVNIVTASKYEFTPWLVIVINILFIVSTIICVHHPFFFVSVYFLFLAYHKMTRKYHYRLNLQAPFFVGIFLCGLIIHAGLQEWWIVPLLQSVPSFFLLPLEAILTSFNENTTMAALSCFFQDATEMEKYLIMAGVVSGGGLTIIAHAPNPIAQNLLRNYFPRQALSFFTLLKYACPGALFFGSLFYLWSFVLF